MRKIISLLFLCCITYDGIATTLCILDTDGADSAYISTSDHTSKWAVGDECNNATLCETPVVIGTSFCANIKTWDAPDFVESDATPGRDCFCHVTQLLIGYDLKNINGLWVDLGQFSNTAECNAQCPKYCIDNITHNAGGMRNALMLLDE